MQPEAIGTERSRCNVPTSRRAIQDDPTSDTELSLDELEQVRGGWEIIPSRPPENSRHRAEYDEGFGELRSGFSDVAGGVVTISRATQTQSDVGFWVQTTAGHVQVATGAMDAIEGYERMSAAAAKHLDDQRQQASEAELRELKELEEQKEAQEEQEREDNRLLQEAEKMLQESSAPAEQGGAGGPPANAETYSGELPSFPAQIINAPPPPQGTWEPVDAGGGANTTPGRIY